MKRKLKFAGITLLILFPFIYGFRLKPEVEEISLKQAIAKGYVQSVFQNNIGYTHYSKCLLIGLKNISGKMLNIRIDNGFQVNPEDSEYQNLIVTENLFVTINPNENKSVPVFAMCTEPHDRAAGSQPVKYTMAKDASGVMKALTELIDKKNYHNSEGQQAVWCVAANRDLDDISGYDTIAVKDLQNLISRLTGKKIPPPPAPDDYKRNYYAPSYTKKITIGGSFEYNFATSKNILIAMFDKNNVVVRELYKKEGETPGNHKQNYEFDASVYTDSIYYIRLVADGRSRLESKITM
jgi:hypothetical protein